MQNVKLYTLPDCAYCELARCFLEKNGIAYEEYNIAENERALAEMVAKSRQTGVPVIDVEGQIFVGFDRSGLKGALRLD